VTVGFLTLGCKLNQCETEALASSIRGKGFSIISGKDGADFYIINTCAVTSKSEQKARYEIRSCAKNNPRSLIIVTGCYAQREEEAIRTLAQNIIVVPQKKKSRLPEAFDSVRMNTYAQLPVEGQKKAFSGTLENPGNTQNVFGFESDTYSFHSRAFLKIQDGCNARCAYCIVPHVRGSSVSIDPEQAIASARNIEEKGYREIVLTGVNISAYNVAGFDLSSLIKGMCSTLTKTRIRLSSIEPDSIDDELCAALAHPAICAHFHIPVQSGSDRILELMKRRYDSLRLREAIGRLAIAKPGSFLGGDVIVGFPGETEDDFCKTKEIVTSLGFSALHVFQFSPRPGTEAYKMPDRVPEKVKKERAHSLICVSTQLFAEYSRKFEGSEGEAILQQRCANVSVGQAFWSGITGNYLKVKISGVPEDKANRGGLVKIRIRHSGDISIASFISFI
jgi:threonylcarbamoyladenosine tRNA methylthiotransferase MtaB